MERDILTRVFDAIVKARVQRGLALLKEKYGEDWIEKIEPSKLALADSAACIVGQIHNKRNEDGTLDITDDNAYVRGLAELNLDWDEEEEIALSQADYYFGFNVHYVTDEELTELGFTEHEKVEFRQAFEENGERLAKLAEINPAEFDSLQTEWNIALGYIEREVA